MKPTARHLLPLALLMLAAGCASTPGSRMKTNRAVFESWPPEVRANVLAGRIDVGYTEEQVRMALGVPTRITTRQDLDGTSAIWTYGGTSPRFSFGLGLGTGGRNTSVGVGVNQTIRGPDDTRDVMFDVTGRVKAIETRER